MLYEMERNGEENWYIGLIFGPNFWPGLGLEIQARGGV